MKSSLLSLLLLLNLCLAGYAQAGDGPNFSWDKVPVYAHFGATNGVTDADIEFIATHYDFITLEKAHGAKIHQGVSEPETFADAARIKAINPHAKVLFYWNLLLDYPLYQSSQERQAPDDWFIHGLDGKLHLKRDIKRYDLSNKELRRWWVKTAKQALIASDMDGVFIDAVPQIGLKREDRIKEWGSEKFYGVEKGISQTLALLKAEIGADKTVIYNGIRSVPGGWQHGGSKYLNNASGIITEHFNMFQSQGSEQIAEDLSRMMQAGKAGKIVIFKAWPGFSWLDKAIMQLPEKELQRRAQKNITFPLAAFLIAASEKSYFNYTWGYRHNHGAYDWYLEYDQKLGAPLSDAKQEGFEYWREFKHASVYLNIKTKQAEINWR